MVFLLYFTCFLSMIKYILRVSTVISLYLTSNQSVNFTCTIRAFSKQLACKYQMQLT